MLWDVFFIIFRQKGIIHLENSFFILIINCLNRIERESRIIKNEYEEKYLLNNLVFGDLFVKMIAANPNERYTAN